MKKVKQEDLKLGIYLITSKGTGFVVGFAAKTAGIFYMYMISDETLYTNYNFVHENKEAENAFTQYIKKVSEVALQSAMQSRRLFKFKSNTAKKYLELPEIEETILKNWKLKSKMLDSSLPEMVDVRPSIEYVPGRVYLLNNKYHYDVEVLCLTKTKFISLDELKNLTVEQLREKLKGRITYLNGFFTRKDMIESKIEYTGKTIDLKGLGL